MAKKGQGKPKPKKGAAKKGGKKQGKGK